MKKQFVTKLTVFCLVVGLLLTNIYAAEGTAPVDPNADAYATYIPSKDKALNYLIARLEDGCPIVSFETTDKFIENAAYTYDNALAAMAFIADGQNENAAEILDAFVAGIEADRYKKDRVRNAYMAGDPTSLPGFWDDAWYEDALQVGSSAGNSSMMALAMLQYYRISGIEEYVQHAVTIMDWVLKDCKKDNSPGFTAGYNGWPENGVAKDVQTFTYKTTWHNIAAYAVFKKLYSITGESKYLEASESARTFVESMYDKKGYFHVGTKDDGITQASYNIALMVQIWPELALGKVFEDSKNAISYALKNMKRDNGFQYSSNKSKDNKNGFWCEGTAFTALAFRRRGDDEKAMNALDALLAVQNPSGSFPAATVDALYTGESLLTGKPYTLNTDPYIAPTAWYVMAICNFNPFTFD